MNGYFSEDPTQPLPPDERGPLLLLIDAQADRRMWVSNLLAYANYHAYSTPTPRESFIWYLQHQPVIHGLLVGNVAQQEVFLVQRLRERMVGYQRKEVPTFSLAAYLPDDARTRSAPLAPRAQGGINLLEALWLQVAR